MKIYTMLLAVGLVTASQWGRRSLIQNLIDAVRSRRHSCDSPGSYFEMYHLKDITLQGAGAGSALLIGNKLHRHQGWRHG